MSEWRIIAGDCRESLATLNAGSVQTCVTSPPYFGLRDYGTGEWEGGDPTCDHRDTAFNAIPQNREGRETPGGRGGSFPTTERGFRDVCGKCGARRVDRQIGLEPTPDEFVQALVEVFREVRRVLRDDGTVWLNLGDSYAGTGERGNGGNGGLKDVLCARGAGGSMVPAGGEKRERLQGAKFGRIDHGVKAKDLIGIPWMVAFALRSDGWYLRSDIIWAKPNPMPESVTDRPTKAHEYLFLLSKSPRYYYDATAIAEQAQDWSTGGPGPGIQTTEHYGAGNGGNGGLGKLADRYRTRGTQSASAARGVGTNPDRDNPGGGIGQGIEKRNKRSVWTVATQPFPGAHFATFPPKLIEPCILAGSSEKTCSECGAPWQRVVERTKMVVKPGPKRADWQASDEHARTQTGGTMVEPPTSRTVGWEPSCAHDAGTTPGVVLDPFAGAGTTGMVALRHNRSFIGIELNPEYVALARDRIIADSPLLNTHAEAA